MSQPPLPTSRFATLFPASSNQSALERWRSRLLSPALILGRPQPDPQGTSATFALLCILMGGLIALWSLARHHTLHSTMYDLGIFHQVLWNTSRLRPFATSLKHMSYLGDHFSPSLVLLAPLEWLPMPLDLLLISQAAAAALTVWNLYKLALLSLGPRGAFLIGLGGLLQPALFCPSLFDIHPEVYMAAALSRALYDLERNRTGAAALWLAIVLGGKEDAGLLLGPLGLVLAMEPRRRRFGLLLAVVSFVWSGLAIGVLMPMFRPHVEGGAWFYLGRYAHLGSSVREIIRTVLLHPLHAIYASLMPWKVVTAVVVLAAWAGAPLLGWRRFLAVLPIAGAHFLSSREWQFHFAFQYLVPTVPVLGWAAIAGAKKTLLRWPQPSVRLMSAVGTFMIIYRMVAGEYMIRAEHVPILQAMALIPEDASVCTQNRAGPLLAGRLEIEFCVLWEVERAQYKYYGWPEFSSATWQLFNTNEIAYEVFPSLMPRLNALRQAGAEVKYERDGVVLLKVTPAVLAAAAKLMPNS